MGLWRGSSTMTASRTFAETYPESAIRVWGTGQPLRGNHAGLLKMKVVSGAGVLAPGEERTIGLAAHLPDTLRPGHSYHGVWKQRPIRLRLHVSVQRSGGYMTITPCKGEKPDTGKLGDLLNELVSALFAFGMELLILAGVGARTARDALGGIKGRSFGSCCDIPEACWMPKPLGEVKCRLKPGATGQVRLVVTNGDFSSHQVTAQSAGADAGLVQVTPPRLCWGRRSAPRSWPNSPPRKRRHL